MDDNFDFDWSADENAGDDHGGHAIEAQALLLQSQASSSLAAMATGNTSILFALLDDLWSKSCMDKVFVMSTWVLIVKQASQACGVELLMVQGDEDGNPKTELTDEEKISEGFLNVLLAADESSEEILDQTINAMHDYFHEVSDRSGRAVFCNVLAASAQAVTKCMELAKANQE